MNAYQLGALLFLFGKCADLGKFHSLPWWLVMLPFFVQAIIAMGGRWLVQWKPYQNLVKIYFARRMRKNMENVSETTRKILEGK